VLTGFSSRPATPSQRSSVAGWALLRDPFRDRYCWSNCTDNSFLLRAEPDLARSLTDLWLRATLAIGVTIVAVLIPIVAVAVTVTASAILMIAERAESPVRRAFMELFVARGGALVGLAAGLTWVILRELRTAGPSPGWTTSLASGPTSLSSTSACKLDTRTKSC
jgi:hypothetical protein